MDKRNPKREYRIGVDTGGTFTDIVLIGGHGGDIRATKVSSTPDDPSAALRSGIDKILGLAGVDAAEIASISHGTTVATNALLQGGIDDLALVVTKGFRHILEIARQSVPESYGNSYFWVKPERIVPVHRVFEIDERLDFKGGVLRELDEDSVRAVAKRLGKYKLSVVGICLIHAYANPAHERRAREILTAECPGLTVSISSDVWPEYREYERAVTTLVDAFVKPHIGQYLARIKDRLPAPLAARPFLVMQSSGGVQGADQVARKPIMTALSGPAAGVIGAAAIAKLAGFDNTITFDAGGTSTDISLIEAAEPRITTNATIGPFPVRLPMIDIRTVGTGGGSIAWISREGRLRVGPRSAGAAPGPMSYPGGGAEPTVTDANLILGRLPGHLIGGAIALDAARARHGIADLGRRLEGDMEVERLAEGIIEIACWNQANLIRQVTVEQGIDPRQFALLAFGGSGPAHSSAVMEILGLGATVIPPDPGNLSALGLLLVDYRTDHVFTRIAGEGDLEPSEVAGIYAKLESEAADTLARDGVAAQDIHLVREADIRYAGQSMEVRVAAPGGALTAASLARIAENFHAAHERAFGYCYRGQQAVEFVNFRISGIGRVDKPDFPAAEVSRPSPPRPESLRPVYFNGAWTETPVYDRRGLTPGMEFSGPAVIEEFGSTTVAFPDNEISLDGRGNLILRREGAGAPP